MAYKLQPANMREKWEEYRRQCDENIETVRYRDKLIQVPKKIIYTLEGFCLFTGMGEDDLQKYENNKNYRALFKNIRYWVMCRKMHALVNGEGNTRGLVYDLKVNHGIDPKQARQEQDWQVTLNLNHDSIVSEGERKPGRPEEGKPERQEENKKVIGSLGQGVNEEREPGRRQHEAPARDESPPVVNNGIISLNKVHTNLPPEPPKMNPYSVW
ncbi:MAG TPA: terminase small subunit [Chitinophagaceae bacterium]|nr:terminase small subunit [Chitinophagaceae bacterium]